jgi:hypothetical protein
MRDPAYVARTAADVFSEAAPTTFDITRDEKAFTAMVRNQLFAFVRSLARRDWNSALELLDEGEEPWTEEKLAAAFTPFLDEFGAPRLDGKGRSPSNTQVQPTELSTGRGWSVIQNLVVGDEISEWVVEGAIDLEASARLGRVVFVLIGLHG